MILTAEHISFCYPGTRRQVLQDVSLTLQQGQRLGLIAPSGFGKTTFCKILSGYLTPDSGTVLLDGRPLTDYPGRCPVQMIFQHPEQSVNPRLRMKTTLQEGGDIPQRIIDGLGIEPAWLQRFPTELSGGELQRFCIARALGEGTRILIADEISTMLDLITQSQIWQFLLQELAQRDIALLAVSHSRPLLERVCTQIHQL